MAKSINLVKVILFMFSKIEIFLANLSFVILFLTMFYYWYQLSLGFKVQQRLTEQTNNLITVNGPLVSSLPESQNYPPGELTKNQGNITPTTQLTDVVMSKGFQTSTKSSKILFLSRKGNRFIPNLAILISFCSLLVLLILRWNEFGHFPLSNLYESLIFLSLSCLLLHFLTQNYFFTEDSQSSAVIPNLFGSITASCALCINAFASFSLPDEMQRGSALVPALQSNWLMMHVTVMITSYGALIVGSLFSIAYLIIDTIITNRVQVLTSQRDANFSQSALVAKDATPHESAPRSESGFLTTNLILTLDNLSYRIIGLGFPLLTIGILSGAVWANEAWGSYWSWDPKETWALLTWFVFAIYLHTRITRGWEGRKSAIMASLGFITVWICFLGVNLLGEGLHSYGFLSK